MKTWGFQDRSYRVANLESLEEGVPALWMTTCPDASKHVSALEKRPHYDVQARVELFSEVYRNGQGWYFIFGCQDDYKLLLEFSGQCTKHPGVCNSAPQNEVLPYPKCQEHLH